MPVVEKPVTLEPPVVAPFADPEALIEEARRRQRRRQLRKGGVLLVVAGGALALWQFAFTTDSPSRAGGHSSGLVTAQRALTLHLIGWGTPVYGYTGRGPCPDGQFVTPIEVSGRKIGAFLACDLADSKTDKPNWGVRSTHAVLSGTYTLRGGAIVTREQRTFRFSRQSVNSAIPVRVRGSFRGRIVGGSGRYAQVRGTISGGGHGVNNSGDWTLTFRFH